MIIKNEKWKMSTGVWLEGYGSQFTLYNYDTVNNSVLINTYVGKYRRNHLKINNQTLTLRKYFDEFGRDTLTVNCFFDTGFTRNIYKVLNDSITYWHQIKNYSRQKEALVMQLKTNLKKEVIELKTLTYNCPEYHYLYKGDLLFRIEHYNCFDRLGDVYIYKYYKY